MMTERGKTILELIKSINAGPNGNAPAITIVSQAVSEYNELVKRNIIESPYKHSNNIEEYKYTASTHPYEEEEPEGWEESMRMLDMMMWNP